MAKTQANPNSDVAKFVRAARTSLGLVQEDFAYKFNCTKGNVSAWEQGRHEPSFAVLNAISSESNVPLPSSAKPDFFPANTSVVNGAQQDKNIVNVDATRAFTGEVPVISWVQAGAWHEIADAFQPEDAPTNMQWQTREDAKAKDKWERKECGK